MVTTNTIMAGSIPPCTIIKKVPTGVVGCHYSVRGVVGCERSR